MITLILFMKELKVIKILFMFKMLLFWKGKGNLVFELPVDLIFNRIL